MLASNLLVIVDSDALIALANIDDIHSDQAFHLAQVLRNQQATLIYPASTIVETTTTLQRKLSKPDLVAGIVLGVASNHFLIELVDQELIQAAIQLFNPYGSKQNTLHDAIVAAVARKRHAAAIFSFDAWYQKIGLSLVADIV